MPVEWCRRLDRTRFPGTITPCEVREMFGDWVRALRKRKGLTQRELGALCGLSASAVGMIEQGRRLPSRAVYARMGAVLAGRDGSFPTLPPRAVLSRDWLEILREPSEPPFPRGSGAGSPPPQAALPAWARRLPRKAHGRAFRGQPPSFGQRIPFPGRAPRTENFPREGIFAPESCLKRRRPF